MWRVADEEDETGDLLGTGCGMLQSSSCGSGPLGERRRGWCGGREGISWSKCSAKRDWRDMMGVVRGGWGSVRLEGWRGGESWWVIVGLKSGELEVCFGGRVEESEG